MLEIQPKRTKREERDYYARFAYSRKYGLMGKNPRRGDGASYAAGDYGGRSGGYGAGDGRGYDGNGGAAGGYEAYGYGGGLGRRRRVRRVGRVFKLIFLFVCLACGLIICDFLFDGAVLGIYV